MAKLFSIPISADELQSRISQISIGDSLETVSGILGGRPYEEEEEAGVRRAYWRFYLLDSAESIHNYEIFQGEFLDNRLVFGSIIPHGASSNVNHYSGTFYD